MQLLEAEASLRRVIANGDLLCTFQYAGQRSALTRRSSRSSRGQSSGPYSCSHENAVERAVILSDGSEVGLTILP